MSSSARKLTAIGWREWVSLPDLCPIEMKAKVDTGARTSSLHAFGLEIIENGPTPLATFEVHPSQNSAEPAFTVETPIVGFKDVRSSSGHQERRPVIKTTLVLGPHRFTIALTLTDRDEMGFRMLLGRAALRRRFLVDSGRSYRHGVPE